MLVLIITPLLAQHCACIPLTFTHICYDYLLPFYHVDISSFCPLHVHQVLGHNQQVFRTMGQKAIQMLCSVYAPVRVVPYLVEGFKYVLSSYLLLASSCNHIL